ncbi:MAG TPA: periplasmic heavy metal sensor [Vicinamibacterales bacterium]
MFRTIRIVFAVLCLALMVTSTYAQGFGFKWWQNDRYRAELGLTADQSRRLEEIFQTTVPTLRAQKKAFDEAETEFNQLVERADDAAVMEQVLKVEAARGELNKTRALMLLRMRRALTTDQWVKLGAMHQADSRDRRQPQQSRGQGK